jgi:hypothetical protein
MPRAGGGGRVQALPRGVVDARRLQIMLHMQPLCFRQKCCQHVGVDAHLLRLVVRLYLQIGLD